MEFFRIRKDIPFMRHALVFNVISLVTFLAAVFFLFHRGLHLSVEFTGGTVIEVQYQQAAELEPVRATLGKLGYADAQVQNFGTSRNVLIRLQLKEGLTSAQQSDQVMGALKAQNPDVTLQRVEFVGPQVGRELATDGLLALACVVIGIVIYLSFRFEWKYAVAGIIANLHDIVIILGFFAFFQWEFSLAVLAAILAVLGYSVNESVVIFDRIRETFRRERKMSVQEVINHAITTTMSRTIITHTSTEMMVLSMFFFGGPTLHYFALALTVGIMFGIYSSVFVAAARDVARHQARRPDQGKEVRARSGRSERRRAGLSATLLRYRRKPARLGRLARATAAHRAARSPCPSCTSATIVTVRHAARRPCVSGQRLRPPFKRAVPMMPPTRVVLRLAACAAVTAALLPCASSVGAQQPASARPLPPLRRPQPLRPPPPNRPRPARPTGSRRSGKAAVEVLKRQHLTDIDIGALLDATTHAGIKTLPYARFFDAKEEQERRDDERRARDGTPGIGIVFETRPDGLHIVDVIPDAPAEKAGVRPDDLVVAMNDTSVVGIDAADLTRLAKGDAGVPLKLTVQRGPSHAVLSVAPVRTILKPHPATAKRLDGDILYTRLSSFPEPAVGDYIDAVQAARRTGPPVRGVILDLRINGGGALNAAIGITALFAARPHRDGDGRARRRQPPPLHDQLARLRIAGHARPGSARAAAGGRLVAHRAARRARRRTERVGRRSDRGGAEGSRPREAARHADLWERACADGRRPDRRHAPEFHVRAQPAAERLPDGRLWRRAGLARAAAPRLGRRRRAARYREADLARAPYADRLAPDPFAKVRKERQKLREQRALAKIDTAKSAALPQREFGTATDWQLGQALAALAGRPVRTVEAKPQLMPAQPVCEQAGN